MGKRSRKRGEHGASAPATEHIDSNGDVLTLRNELSAGTIKEAKQLDAHPAASADDRWQRRSEFMFERLAVRWVIADLEITHHKELLGRYRMADSDTRQWVRETIDAHLEKHQPEALPEP